MEGDRTGRRKQHGLEFHDYVQKCKNTPYYITTPPLFQRHQPSSRWEVSPARAQNWAAPRSKGAATRKLAPISVASGVLGRGPALRLSRQGSQALWLGPQSRRRPLRSEAACRTFWATSRATNRPSADLAPHVLICFFDLLAFRGA